MKTLDLTLSTPEENLACDEALLNRCERENSEEVLRFWESPRPFVVLGISNAHRSETLFNECVGRGIPVLRRCSGGGAVLQGPGCLNYALVLQVRRPGPLETLTAANRFILERHRETIERLIGRPVVLQGSTDLTLEGLKFSGNSQRRKTGWLLFHGTFLHRLDLPLMEALLPFPSRQPAYRRGRSHARFLTHLPAGPGRIKEALRETWGTDGDTATLPREELSGLLKSRYCREEWNLRD